MTHPNDDDQTTEEPSKSARKRAALEAQQLGVQLVGLGDAELEALGLPERLNEAIREARRINSRSAGARQRQYIGRLMRELDLTAVRSALAAREAQRARDARRFKDIEAWRDRLLADAAGLDELAQQHPRIERSLWERAIAAAALERTRSGTSGSHARELFRMLRELLQGPSRT
jgi:ribosome-associated protein